MTLCLNLSYFASSMLRCTIITVSILLCVYAEKCQNSQNLSHFEKKNDSKLSITTILKRLGVSRVHLGPLVAWAAVYSKAVVLLLLIHCLMYFPLFEGVLCLSLFWYALLCVLSSFAIILKRKKEPVALLLLSYKCLVTVNGLWLFLTVPSVGLLYVIVVHCISQSCSLIFGTVIPVNMIIYYLSNIDACTNDSFYIGKKLRILLTPPLPFALAKVWQYLIYTVEGNAGASVSHLCANNKSFLLMPRYIWTYHVTCGGYAFEWNLENDTAVSGISRSKLRIMKKV